MNNTIFTILLSIAVLFWVGNYNITSIIFSILAVISIFIPTKDAKKGVKE